MRERLPVFLSLVVCGPPRTLSINFSSTLTLSFRFSLFSASHPTHPRWPPALPPLHWPPWPSSPWRLARSWRLRPVSWWGGRGWEDAAGARRGAARECPSLPTARASTPPPHRASSVAEAQRARLRQQQAGRGGGSGRGGRDNTTKPRGTAHPRAPLPSLHHTAAAHLAEDSIVNPLAGAIMQGMGHQLISNYGATLKVRIGGRGERGVERAARDKTTPSQTLPSTPPHTG